MTVLATFAAAAVATYALRASMVLGGDRLLGSDRLRAAVASSSPAVLAAMVASSSCVLHGTIAAPPLAEALALAAAVVAVRRTGNVGAALAVGFPVYWSVQAIAG